MSNDDIVIDDASGPAELLQNKELINKIEYENSLLRNEEPNQIEEFFSKSKDSLMLHQEKKHEMFERLRVEWKSQHRRIQDFKTKQLVKFPQIFVLNYQSIFDLQKRVVENKSNLCSKYTFNLENDVEVDLGGNLYMRDNLGLGNIFSAVRFYSFDNKVFTNMSYSMGDKHNLALESNYLFSNSFLLDYMYKYNNIEEKNKHKFTCYKIFKNDLKTNFGVKISNKFDNFSFFCGGKKIFKSLNRSVEGNLKIGKENYFCKLNLKMKENIKNFYLITDHSVKIDRFFPTFTSHNQIVYKYYNRFFKIGYFSNFNGIGVEIGYQNAGVNVTLPFLFTQGEFNLEEQVNKSIFSHLFNFLLQTCVFIGLNYATKFVIKKIKNYLKSKNRKQFPNENSKSEKLKKRVNDMRQYQEKIVKQIKIQAEKKQELEKGKNYGLIINFAVYGNKHTLTKIMNESNLINSENLEQLIQEIENEVIDVTIPVKYMIRRDEKTSISSILFHQRPKTKIIGFINPIYNSEKAPWILINYKIGNNTHVIMKKDSEIFQIPENIIN